jgi:hypothetical protein
MPDTNDTPFPVNRDADGAPVYAAQIVTGEGEKSVDDSPQVVARRVALLALQRAEKAGNAEEMERYTQVAYTAIEVAARSPR